METKKANKTEEQVRLRGDLLTFARRISHDLRTPLGGIIAAGEALKETLAENGLPAVLADSVLNSAEELSGLIKRVSFLAKASASPSLKEPVLMADVVSMVLQQLESRILKQKAVITQSHWWPEVQGVPAWLEIIWWNLLVNALQHTGASPEIELGAREEGKNFRFWVSDNGSGVSEAARVKLFQTFHSLHESDSARGLGLPIVQRLVELQDGTCGYEAEPDGSGCFYFTLPVAG
jgi:signal transduction histidine kinase